MPTDAPQLEYAHEPDLARRRNHRRVFAAILAIGVVLAATHFGSPALHHAQLLYWQRQCLTYQPPAAPPVRSGAHGPSAAPWREFYNRFSPPGRKALGTVFLHELRKTDGTRRLVVLEAETFTGLGATPDSRVTFDYHVIAPGTLWQRPQLVSSASVGPYFRHEAGAGAYLDIHSGRPDPEKASHFTIDVRWRDKTISLDGWLRSDDSIILESRESLGALGASDH